MKNIGVYLIKAPLFLGFSFGSGFVVGISGLGKISGRVCGVSGIINGGFTGTGTGRSGGIFGISFWLIVFIIQFSYNGF